MKSERRFCCAEYLFVSGPSDKALAAGTNLDAQSQSREVAHSGVVCCALATSRDLNSDCMVLEHFDAHDMW